MDIKEKDFKIIYEHNQYVLYVIKSKKELKDDDKDAFKLYGYYTFVENALQAVVKFRKDKKYPGKETITQLKLDIIELRNTRESLYNASESIYNPIINSKRLLKW